MDVIMLRIDAPQASGIPVLRRPFHMLALQPQGHEDMPPLPRRDPRSAMEHVVESLIVPCCNARHGCAEKVTYYQKEAHEKEACPYAPCSCPAPGCRFAGPAAALLDHCTARHKLPATEFNYSDSVSFSVKPGLRVLRCRDNDDAGRFFLIHMATEPLGHAVSVVRVQPNSAADHSFVCDMYYDCFVIGFHQGASCRIRNSSLWRGMPAGYDFILPKGKVSDHQEGGIMLKTTIRKSGEVQDKSDDEMPLSVRRARRA